MDTLSESSTASFNAFGLTSTIQADDSLLAALLCVCKLLHSPQSATTLTSGLPLVENKLTPALLVRAAERAGLAAGLVKRPLQKISNLVLPAILILNQQKACVLIKNDQDLCTLLIPETDNGEKTVTLAELQAEYSGVAIFLQRRHQFDQRTDDLLMPKAKHWFWDVIYKSWPIYTEVIIASLLINIFALVSPLFTMNVYDRVVPNHAIETLWVLAIGVAIVYSFDLVMKALRGYFIDTAGKRADIILSATIFEKILAIRMEAKPNSVGAFASNLNEFESTRDFLTSATLTTLIDLPFLVIFVAIIAVIGGNLALIPLAILPIALLSGLAVQKPLKDASVELCKHAAEKNATLIEALANLDTLKGFGAEGQMQRQWEQTIGGMAKLSLKARFYAGIMVNITAFLQQLAAIGTIVLGVYKIADGDLTTGGLIACTLLSGRAVAPIGQVAALLTRYHQAKASLSSLNRLMALPVERETGKRFLHRPVFQGNIEFKNVSFNYPNQANKALNNISFKITAGERVGIIGRIGSGKTTLEKLILAFYEPQDGAILIDDTDSRQIDPSVLRRQVGYVPQDISLLFGSVKDNITLGANYADDAAILSAAEIAGVTHFVNKHPDGFDMPVGERGAALSGGQRQSVAVARALLFSPGVFILDEPTNAMDNSTEEAFKDRFAKQLPGKTLLLVTHRASLLTLVDRLIVLDNAHIVADGPKQQVLDALKQGQIKVSG